MAGRPKRIQAEGEIKTMIGANARNIILSIAARPGADGDTINNVNAILDGFLADDYKILAANAFAEVQGTVLVYVLVVKQ